VDTVAGTQTRLDEEGPVILPSEVQKLQDKVRQLLTKKAEMLIMSGSAPRGTPFTIYADLIALAKQRGVPTILDTRDEPLAEGVAAKPDAVKPNLAELQTLVGDPALTPEAGVAEAAQSVVSQGVDLVCVSLGKAGAVAATRKRGTWRASPPPIKYVSSVGSGDAMVAGLAVGLLEKRPIEDILRLAVGCGSADAATFGAGFASREQMLQCAQGVKVQRVT
jgi:1-phosphofructokinase family hexose kinase